MNVHTHSTNSLLQRLFTHSPELLSSFERVSLEAGLWSDQALGGDDFLYFPEAGLLALSGAPANNKARAAPGTRLVLLGCHDVWSPRQMGASPLQARVLVPGHALRISQARLPPADKLLANWALQCLASSQKLMNQMALMAACQQQHSASESLASWLLIARHNSPAGPLQIPLQALRDWLGMAPEPWHKAWLVLAQEQALALVGQGAQAMIDLQSAGQLSDLACACHQTGSPL